MSQDNVIWYDFKKRAFIGKGHLWQYDYGQRLILSGIDLPSNYEVHFQSQSTNEATVKIGDATGVDIPDACLLRGNSIRFWVYVHSGSDDGETLFSAVIPVFSRARPDPLEPTPVQQDSITQAIAALDQAVEETTEAKNEAVEASKHYPIIIDSIWYVWDVPTGDYISTGVSAEGDVTDEEFKEGLYKKASAVYVSISGDSVAFEDGSDGEKVKALVVFIDPIQDLHGYDFPWGPGGWKNLYDAVSYPLTQGMWISGQTGVASTVGGSSFACTEQFVPFEGFDGQYITLNKRPGGTEQGIAFYSLDSQAGFISGAINNDGTTGSGLTALVPPGTRYIRFTVPINAVNIQIEVGSLPTFYAPYSNICPIYGRTDGSIVVSREENAQDNTDYDISWESEVGTVYGGTFDTVSGVLSVTYYQIASYNGEVLPGKWISDRDAYAPMTTPTIGAQVIYEAPATTYQLESVVVTTLYGKNYIWADCGKIVELMYLADTKLYIEQLTKPDEDDMTANANIQRNKFFMIGNRLFMASTNIAQGTAIIPGTNCMELSLADALNQLNA